jgi:hypothetical protein
MTEELHPLAGRIEQLCLCCREHVCDTCHQTIKSNEYAFFWGDRVWCLECDRVAR